MAGRILTRFLKAAQDNQVVEQLIPLKTEVSFIRSMLLRAGERIPLACEWRPIFHAASQLSLFGRLLLEDAGRSDPTDRSRGGRTRDVLPSHVSTHRTAIPVRDGHEADGQCPWCSGAIMIDTVKQFDPHRYLSVICCDIWTIYCLALHPVKITVCM